MNKKGFTLIEIMAVIIILGVIVLIATPAIRNLTAEGKEELYNIQISNIKDGLKNWAIDNSKILPQIEGDVITITLGQLKMGGYVDIELKNPKNNKCFGNDMTLEITRYQKNYIYTVNDTTGTETTNCDDYRKPYIILNGTAITYVELNDSYVDEGVIAKDASGNDITNSVTTTITGSGTTIDTTKVGNKYTIAYTITVGSDTTSINRTVIVRDTVAPILTIPSNVTLGKNATSFDLMEGVSATDNSGETVEVTAKSNISFGIPGEYTITYTATDSSGNTTTKTRLLTIYGYKNGIMSSLDNCINTGTCENGTTINVQVNSSENYKFYVIADTGTKLTLIMDRNLGSTVAWISSSQYSTANADDNTACEYDACTDEGPLTALETLETRTSGWTNIPEFTYTVVDDYSTPVYQSLERQNVRARLLTVTEAQTLGCTGYENTCPSYLLENLDALTTDVLPWGHWTTSAVPHTTNDYGAFLVHYNGQIHHASSFDYASYGIRPVIELSK